VDNQHTNTNPQRTTTTANAPMDKDKHQREEMTKDEKHMESYLQREMRQNGS